MAEYQARVEWMADEFRWLAPASAAEPTRLLAYLTRLHGLYRQIQQEALEAWGEAADIADQIDYVSLLVTLGHLMVQAQGAYISANEARWAGLGD